MTAHELARKLLEAPDLSVYLYNEQDIAECVGWQVADGSTWLGTAEPVIILAESNLGWNQGLAPVNQSPYCICRTEITVLGPVCKKCGLLHRELWHGDRNMRLNGAVGPRAAQHGVGMKEGGGL